MKIVVKGKNVKISDELQSNIEKKVSKLDRYLDNILEAKAELTLESTRNLNDQHVVQLTISRNGTLLRAEERGLDYYTALDAALEKLQNQIKRFKDKRHDRKKEGPSAAAVGAVPPVEPLLVPTVEETEEEAEQGPPIARVKQFVMKPMFDDEAIEQMELLGHSFFVFYNAATEKVSVVYKRDNGTYGLIEPEMP